MNVILEYFNCYLTMKKNWVLDYPCEGKGVTPYEKVKKNEGLDAAPEEEFFSKTEFCSTLRNEIIDDQSHENVHVRFWKTLRMRVLK